jgi:hypothetical protein
MEDLYATVFRLFSADIHSSPQSLTPYFVFDGEKIKAIEWGPNLEVDFSPALGEISRLYLDSLERVAALFKMDLHTVIKPLVAEHTRLGREGVT